MPLSYGTQLMTARDARSHLEAVLLAQALAQLRKQALDLEAGGTGRGGAGEQASSAQGGGNGGGARR